MYWDAGEVGYVENENDKAWRKLTESLRCQEDPDDVERNEKEDETEEETSSIKEEKKKPFLRLLMEKIRRKKKPAQSIPTPSSERMEQSFQTFTQLQDLF